MNYSFLTRELAVRGGRAAIRGAILACLAVVAAAAATNGPTLPPLPEAGYAPIDACDYADTAAVQTAWVAKWGTAPAERISVGQRSVVKLPFVFAGNRLPRASWDRDVRLDLGDADGLRFQFHCPDPSAVSHFTCYLRSGAGWFAVPFQPPDDPGWGLVEIRKSEAEIEDSPDGWGKIDGLRISAWRAADTNGAFMIANLGRLGGDAPIAIIRGDSASSLAPDEARSVTEYTRSVALRLRELGLEHDIISDRDLTPQRLAARHVVILPHNPTMPDSVVECLARYLQAGGNLICFYTLPAALTPSTGIGQGRYIAPGRTGRFTTIRATDDGGLVGQPAAVAQRSWNINQGLPIPGRSRPVAFWYDAAGSNTTEAAIVLSSNCIFMTHVLTDEDPAAKRKLLLAMVGHWIPDAVRETARRRIARLDVFGPYVAPGQAASDLQSHTALNARASAHLAAAGAGRADAEAHLAAGRFDEALDAADRARRELIEAWCATLSPTAGEHRAFWCHSAFGVEGMTWEAAARRLAENGFTAILPNMLWGGVAYYDSRVLPAAPEVARRGDQIRACLAACRTNGLECHVWKVNWNMGWNAPADFRQRMKSEGRTQVGFNGKPEDDWLCPSHPANRQLEIDSMLEVATRYAVDGLHFDYIRYPDADHCFCAGCRERFEKELGAPVADWPGGVLNDAPMRARWFDFRRANITRVVRAVSEGARRIRPGIKISAAVFANWPVDRDGVGQDWKAWCEAGYLDFVCPMDYTPGNARFESWVRQQRAWAGAVPCYPGIGLSTWSESDPICRLAAQVAITRKLGTGGFTVFNYGAPEAADIVPLCGAGLTRPPGAPTAASQKE